MIITLIPQRSDRDLTLHRTGDVLTINGVSYDFGSVADGSTLPKSDVDCPALAGDVTRSGGVLHIALILPHGANAPPETLFPTPITVTSDGPVTLPPYDQHDEDGQ